MRGSGFLCFMLLLLVGCQSGETSGRRYINEGWRFVLEDQPEASQEQFDDSQWRVLDVPHDWAFEEGYSEDGAQQANGGYLCGGIGWYRKYLDFTKKELQNRVFRVEFEGVYMNSEVWINGEYLGKRPYGYISFSYDLTKYLKPGRNVLSVRVDNSLEPSARWYHGCGIYGNVSLVSSDPLHFVPDATFVTTPEITDQQAKVSVTTALSQEMNNTVEVEYRVLDAQGKTVAEAKGGLEAELAVPSPMRWSVEQPYLYTLETTVRKDGQVCDTQRIRFGIRQIEWRTGTGFWLNGQNVKLNGVCEHLEGGPIGAAWNRKLMEWKLRMLKDMGCNAIRTAHNPQLPVFYDLCDSLGILVMDEIFDGWRKKAAFDYGMQAFDEWWERDLRSFIRRDRNHPCVVIYSVGNETKGAVASDLVRVCHEEDSTRPVTSGHSGSEYMDVLGINGHCERKNFLTTFDGGDKPFVGTETPHTWQVRGFYRTQTWYRDGYPNPAQQPFETPNLTPAEIFGYEWTSPAERKNIKQVFNSSYDNAFVRINARQNMEYLRDKAWYSGHFRWTGFDYLGEAGFVHGGWPFRAFMGGVIDMAGFPKDHYYLYQSQWNPEVDMVHILPHWTHPRMEPGTGIPVWVYTTGDEAELFLNGRSLGRREKERSWDKMQCEWMVPWEEGMLEAVAFRNGAEIARTVMCTAAQPSRLALTSDTQALQADGKDVAIVTIEQQDSAGTLYPYGENRVYFRIEGDAFVRSAESGNPVDTECNYRATSKRPFFGLLRLFVQAGKERGAVSVLCGTISGDKALWVSPLVSIDVQEVALRGRLPRRNLSIYYTTDGSDPDTHSERYEAPFAVEDGTLVKAVVYDRGREVLRMEERFGKNEGLYWGTPGEVVCTRIGEEAEEAKYKHATVTKLGETTCVALKPGKGQVSWYQENDGNRRRVKLSLVYAGEGTESVRVAIYNNDKLAIEKLTLPVEKSGEWQMKNVEITIFPGANDITVRNVGSNTVLVDKIIITN